MIAEHDTSGFVYVMTNASMPGIVKIGKTERLPAVRARELFTTGVPVPFKVEFAIFSTNADQLEATVHADLDDNRLSDVREFFRIEVEEAIIRILSAYSNDFCMEIVACDLVLEDDDLARYSAICGQHPFSIPRILQQISPSAWKAASSLYDAWLSRRSIELDLSANLEGQSCGAKTAPKF